MQTGSGETTIREPLYVFAVDDDLAAHLTDKVKIFADHVIRLKNRSNNFLHPIDSVGAHMCYMAAYPTTKQFD